MTNEANFLIKVQNQAPSLKKKKKKKDFTLTHPHTAVVQYSSLLSWLLTTCFRIAQFTGQSESLQLQSALSKQHNCTTTFFPRLWLFVNVDTRSPISDRLWQQKNRAQLSDPAKTFSPANWILNCLLLCSHQWRVFDGFYRYLSRHHIAESTPSSLSVNAMGRNLTQKLR